jgi:predicted metal-binding membrane protein
MASANTALPRPARLDLRQLLLRHPELGAAAVVAASWLTLLVLAVARSHGSGLAAGTGGMDGMTMRGGATPGSTWTVAVTGVPSWVLMTVAMMGPAALGAIQYTGLNSLRWRRRRAMAEFSAGYITLWAVFGMLALAAAALVPGSSRTTALATVLAAAAAWQLTPVKQWSLLACHRTVPLPPRGWRAEKADFGFGLRNGLACVGSCWCLMLITAVAPGGQLLWTGALTTVVTAERLARRPRRATQATAAVLGFATMATLAMGNLLR